MAAGPATGASLADFAREPAVTYDGTVLDVADLVLLGIRDGTWQTFHDGVARGCALAAPGAEASDPGEVRAAATAFRYAHGLISAKEFVDWLTARRLVTADLAGVFGRRLLRERDSAVASGSVDITAAVEPVLWAELVVDGLLTRLGRTAADLLVAGGLEPGDRAVGVAPGGVSATGMAMAVTGLSATEIADRLQRLEHLERCRDAFTARSSSQDALTRCLDTHGWDWVTVDGLELQPLGEGAAREARMLLQVDRLPVSEVESRARVLTRPRTLFVGDVPADVESALAQAAPGEVAGPWSEEGAWRILLVQQKREPTIDDPAVRERAVVEVVREAFDRESAGRVTWSPIL
jgi:hypothetical protein